MTLPVSLSLALYKGLATSVLIELRRRLQRENLKISSVQKKLSSFGKISLV